MEVITNKYNFNSEEYLKILLKQYVKKRVFFYLVLFAIWAFLLPGSNNWLLFIGLLIFIMVLNYFSYRRYAFSKENRNFIVPRTYTFTESEVKIQKENKEEEIVPWDYFVKFVKLGNHYLLHTNQTNFIPVSKSIFKNEIDQKLFEKYARQIS